MKLKKGILTLFVGIFFMILLAFLRSFQNNIKQTLATIIVCTIMGLLLKRFLKGYLLIFILPFLCEYTYFYSKNILNVNNLYEIISIISITSTTYNFLSFKVLLKILLPILYLSFASFYIFYFLPRHDWKTLSSSSKQVEPFTKYNTDSIVLLDLDSNKIDYNKVVNNKRVLADFSFTRCLPCKLKYPCLINLAEQNKNDTSLLVMRIITGKIDTYGSFKEYYKLLHNEKKGMPVYYDIDGKLTNLLGINIFPTEYIFDKKQNLQFRFEGFSPNISCLMYLSQTQIKIKSLR
jgi:thiol-disulfide isomerase/thioredoxin